MDIVCPGWGVPPIHKPKKIGEKQGAGTSHTCCAECEVEMEKQFAIDKKK
jgi:hypothetical protein